MIENCFNTGFMCLCIIKFISREWYLAIDTKNCFFVWMGYFFSPLLDLHYLTEYINKLMSLFIFFLTIYILDNRSRWVWIFIIFTLQEYILSRFLLMDLLHHRLSYTTWLSFYRFLHEEIMRIWNLQNIYHTLRV